MREESWKLEQYDNYHVNFKEEQTGKWLQWVKTHSSAAASVFYNNHTPTNDADPPLQSMRCNHLAFQQVARL